MKNWFTFVPLSVFWLWASSAQAIPTFYETTLLLETPVFNDSLIDRIVFDWSSEETMGTVDESELESLTVSLFEGVTNVYTDNVIVGGMVQPIGGVARVIADVFWRFELAGLTLTEFRNVGFLTILGTAGTQYLVTDNVSLPADSKVVIVKVTDGLSGPVTTDFLDVQNTVVPESTSVALFGFGLFVVGLLARSRKQG